MPTSTPAGARVALCAPGEIWGGVEQCVETLARHLMAQQIPVVVVTMFDGPLRAKLAGSKVPSEVVSGGARAVADLRQLFRRYRINVVHTHGYKATVLGTLAARLCGARLIRTEHGRLEPMRGWNHLKMRANTGLEMLLSRYAADAVVFVSRDVQAQSWSAPPRARQEVIYNGIDPTPNGTSASPLAELDDFPGCIKAGIVGRISEVKGHRYLFQALERLPHLAANLRLYVFGEGPLEAEFKALCEANGLSRQVRFMGFRPDVRGYLQRLDLLVMPSLHEGLPYTLLEAMYHRVPVVASAVGGLAEILHHDATGVLVPPADPAALATALDRVCLDANLRKGIADRAHDDVRDRFLVSTMSARYLDLYERVLAA